MNETQELILERLGEIARMCPQQRMGQIIFNYVLINCFNHDTFYVEDEELLEIVEKELLKLKKYGKKC